MADCACSGIRSCLLCENKKDGNCGTYSGVNHDQKSKTLIFCVKCQKICLESSKNEMGSLSSDTLGICPEHDCIVDIVSGITVLESFITENEEKFMVEEIEKFHWRVSQSGRRKQDFGPKVNFKKQKLKTGNFTGLPHFSKFIVERLQDVPQLKNFHPVELCDLEYLPERGASIDPHIDDTWLWGEHLVTINLLSATILTLTDSKHLYEIKIPMPRHSLVILKGDARHQWKHGIKREDINARRIAVTLRELSEEFLSGNGYTQTGSALLELAASFNGMPTST